MSALRAIAIIGLFARTNAHGSGAWQDPNHSDPSVPLAGMRYISESPPHVLTMVGTDDGSKWWSLTGWCTSPDDGPPMTLIHFDFSPKGGPADLTGTWTRETDGSISLYWPDGNAWKMVGESSDAKFVPTPTALQAASPAMTHAASQLAPILALAAAALVAGVAIGKTTRLSTEAATASAGFAPMQEAA